MKKLVNQSLLQLIFAFISLTALWFAVPAQASPVDTYEFSDQVTKDRYQALVKELRCPKCQNQNLADSNSEIAVDLRHQVYVMLNQGKADSEIVQFMVERYGDFVLYRPQVSPLTYILWFSPLALILIGALVIIIILRNKPKAVEQELSDEQQKQLQQILKDK